MQSSPTANSQANKIIQAIASTVKFYSPTYFEFILYFQGGRTHSRSRSDSMLSDEFADILAMKASSPLGRAHTMEQGHWQQITGKHKKIQKIYFLFGFQRRFYPLSIILLNITSYFFIDYFISSFFSKF